MKNSNQEEAEFILNIFRFYKRDSVLYLNEDTQTLNQLFDAVVSAINTAGPLKTQLPYVEFVLPSKRIEEGDAGWIGHFQDLDNRRFFLSDVYDFLTLFYSKRRREVNA
jgi:hypothetical protein